MITIALADGDPTCIKEAKEILQSEHDFQVVAEAADGLEAVQQVETLKPDILVLDLKMEKLNGLVVTRQLSEKYSALGIVVRTMHGGESLVLEALRFGARAYVLKFSPHAELVRAIREVLAGRRFLCSLLSQNAIDAYTCTTAVTTDPYETLSLREKEVLHLAVKGNTNAEIAVLLDISSRTVETHRFNTLRKLGIGPSELMSFAVARGIISREKES